MFIRAFFRVILSIIGAALPVLFLSGSYSPLGSFLPGSYLPSIMNLFGKESSLGNLIGLQVSPVLPVGAAGLTGFATYSVIQRVLSSAQRMTYSRPNMDMSQMVKNLQDMMPSGMGSNRMSAGPGVLPSDMTRSQFLILSKYQQGFGKPRDIAKRFSMDRKHVENDTDALRSNGYLTNKNKLTSKGLEALN